MKYLVLVALFLVACGSKQTSQEQLKSEVMKIHDDSMAEMGKVREAAFKLSELAETHSDSIIIKNLVAELEAADEGMMMWMAEYKEPEQNQLKSYLDAEKLRIKEVANHIYKSLENAQKYIDK